LVIPAGIEVGKEEENEGGNLLEEGVFHLNSPLREIFRNSLKTNEFNIEIGVGKKSLQPLRRIEGHGNAIWGGREAKKGAQRT